MTEAEKKWSIETTFEGEDWVVTYYSGPEPFPPFITMNRKYESGQKVFELAGWSEDEFSRA